ncbi:tetratricopeptide repeat protein [Haliangium sp.]|uniref:tetratricopeptide repeat protein n=1 Tax=Haliangium sp. TaxID=2663208 RepID=UPI003D09C838
MATDGCRAAVTMWTVAAVGLMAAASARADPPAAPPGPPDPEVVALFDEGQSLFRQGDYAQALERFEEAHARYPDPRLLVSIGSSLVKLRRWAEAANAYQGFLAAGSSGPEADRVRDLLAHTLAPRLAVLEVRAGGPGVEVFVDETRFTGPSGRLIWCRPGVRRVRVRGGRYREGPIEVRARAGERIVIEVPERDALGPVPSPAPAPAPEPAPVVEDAPPNSAADPTPEAGAIAEGAPTSPTARASVPPIPSGSRAAGGRAWRLAFYTAAAVAGVSLGAAAVTHYQTRGPLKEAQLAAIADAGVALDPVDACADAEGRGVDEVVEACRRGRQRAWVSNGLQITAAASLVAAGVFLYRGYFRAGTAERERGAQGYLRPALGRGYAGVDLGVRF